MPSAGVTGPLALPGLVALALALAAAVRSLWSP